MIKIDPNAITNYNRTDAELEAFWLFCLSVAGKKASTIATKVEEFINISPTNSPFDFVRISSQVGILTSSLRKVKMGKYSLLTKGYSESASKGISWFKTATAEDIRTNISGAGFKTSRFFTLHSRKNEQVAVIDTHMLKYLKNEMKIPNVPSTIPTGQEYLNLEKLLIAEAVNKKCQWLILI